MRLVPQASAAATTAAVERLKSDFIRAFPLVRRELDPSVPPGKDPVSRRIDRASTRARHFLPLIRGKRSETVAPVVDLLRARNNLSDSEMRINQAFPQMR